MKIQYDELREQALAAVEKDDEVLRAEIEAKRIEADKKAEAEKKSGNGDTFFLTSVDSAKCKSGRTWDHVTSRERRCETGDGPSATNPPAPRYRGDSSCTPTARALLSSSIGSRIDRRRVIGGE